MCFGTGNRSKGGDPLISHPNLGMVSAPPLWGGNELKAVTRSTRLR